MAETSAANKELHGDHRPLACTRKKVMLCDDWVSVGSANLDSLSMRINRELNLGLSDGSVVRDLEKQVFLPDFRVSRRIRLKDTEGVGNAFAETVADQL
jgi:cardiolipin synthase